MINTSSLPVLRFPDFNDRWDPIELGEIIIKMQSGISRKLRDNDVGYPILRSNNLRNGKLDVTDIKYWYTIDDQGAKLSNYFLEDGDILVNFINSISQIGKVALFENLLGRETIFTTNIMRLSFKNGFNPVFVFNHFHLYSYDKWISSITKPAVNQASFTTKEFQKYILTIPSLPEQQKIAAFLSAVDKKIQQLQRKKELLEQYKKGVMQKIFSQEIRFKDEDGNDYPNWEELRIGDLIEEHRGGASLSPSDFVNTSGFEVIPKKAVSKGGVLKLDVENPTYCNESYFNNNEMNVIDDSFVITTLRDLVPSGPNIGYVVKYEGDSRYILAQGVYGFKIDSSVSIPDFLIQLSNTSLYRKIMQEIMVGSTQVHIRNSDYFKVPISVPCIAEQLRITALLNSIDHRIESLRVASDKNLSFKKGLLQQMFV